MRSLLERGMCHSRHLPGEKRTLKTRSFGEICPGERAHVVESEFVAVGHGEFMVKPFVLNDAHHVVERRDGESAGSAKEGHVFTMGIRIADEVLQYCPTRERHACQGFLRGVGHCCREQTLETDSIPNMANILAKTKIAFVFV